MQKTAAIPREADAIDETTPAAAVSTGAPAMSPRTRALLEGPIVPTLVRLSWPNILVTMAQASTGLVET